MTSRPSIGRTRSGLLNTMFSASSALTWAGVALPDSRSLRKGCILVSPMIVTVPVTLFLAGRLPCEVEHQRFLISSFPSGLDLYFRHAVAGFDGLDRVFKRLFQNALADCPDHEAEQLSLQVLAVAYDDHVNVGLAVGPTSEGVGMTRRASPQVGVGCREDDAVGVGPVVVQAFPD